MTTRLSAHFTLEELTNSEVAIRKGLDNTPGPTVLNNLRVLARALEVVRGLLEEPLYVLSGFRTVAVNEAVGGARTSAHLEGWAADFVCPSFGPPKSIVEELQGSELSFDQLIYEGTWVHLSVDPKKRGQVLTAHFTAGKVIYTEGLT